MVGKVKEQQVMSLASNQRSIFCWEEGRWGLGSKDQELKT